MNVGDVSLDRILVPVSVDEAAAADFCAAIDIRNRVGAEVIGPDWVEVTPDQALPLWLDQSDEEVHGWVVRVAGEIVGRALIYVPLEEGSRRAQLRIDLLRRWHGRGIGRRALEFLEDRARERGRPIAPQAILSKHSPRSGGSEADNHDVGLYVRTFHPAEYAID